MTARVSGLKRDLDRILEILADVVLRPHFAEAEAARTRGEILAALERANDNPHALVRRFAVATLYPNHRAALPLSGSPETVPTLDAAMARDFHQRMFVPNNAILSASGDVEADDLLARVATAFGAWTPAVVPDPGPALPSPTPAARRIVVVDRPDLVQARISLAHEGIARTDPDRVAAALMNSVIGGGGFSSRLMNTLRVEAGLTYSVSSGFSMRRRGGVFSVSTFTRVAEVRRAIDLLLVELERARTDPPSEAELINARALAVGGFSLALETSDAVLGSLVDLEVYGLPEDSLDTYRSRVRATTTEETAELARRLLHPDRAAIILVGPAATLQPAVADLGTVEVVTP